MLLEAVDLLVSQDFVRVMSAGCLVINCFALQSAELFFLCENVIDYLATCRC